MVTEYRTKIFICTSTVRANKNIVHLLLSEMSQFHARVEPQQQFIQTTNIPIVYIYSREG
ncbi:hypothetical protein WN55_02940 [Dufourea novaeangliae]|uniref:Uncharacterized protein n=1 Tax=Dufourea novaeangliae TaxID=178035 RepID=A0A154PK36_DUFNO|nr:hypothetical protein WN55_02940 [Dufourea novaeangliae]